MAGISARGTGIRLDLHTDASFSAQSTKRLKTAGCRSSPSENGTAAEGKAPYAVVGVGVIGA